ncbi:MAG TPA: polysaccharide deacetylase family protein [Chryseolinea sp.]
MRIATIFSLLALWVLCSCKSHDTQFGETEIVKWKGNKTAAISITYDDATINQFRQALPIMDTLGFKGTFFINTADIPGSMHPPKFIGRPLGDIIHETANTPTNANNLFERASALRFLDIDKAIELHNQAGSLFEQNKTEDAFKVVDEAYQTVRKKKSTREIRPVLLEPPFITWPEINEFADRGHEFGSHTISHPRLAVLDEQNLLYEMEKCKEEILAQLGPAHTFSAECPFGTENERVMEYAYKIHPALRNRMPETFLEELNRGNSHTPGEYDKEYIQWQRGPLKKTTMDLMKSWVDTLLIHDNVWLVLTFHGIDGIGWEAKPHEELKEFFTYMKKHEEKLWIATFGEATKYIRERMAASAKVENHGDKIVIKLSHTLDRELYDVPLTLKTYVNEDWDKVLVKQGTSSDHLSTSSDDLGSYVLYDAIPNEAPIELSSESQ